MLFHSHLVKRVEFSGRTMLKGKGRATGKLQGRKLPLLGCDFFMGWTSVPGPQILLLRFCPGNWLLWIISGVPEPPWLAGSLGHQGQWVWAVFCFRLCSVSTPAAPQVFFLLSRTWECGPNVKTWSLQTGLSAGSEMSSSWMRVALHPGTGVLVRDRRGDTVTEEKPNGGVGRD